MDHQKTTPCATSQDWFECGRTEQAPQPCDAYLLLPHNLRYNCDEDWRHLGTHGCTLENDNFVVYIRWGSK